MKKSLLIAVFAISVSGCNYYSDSMVIAQQDYACRNNGGVYEYGNFSFNLQCMDGTIKDLSHILGSKIPPEFYPKKER